MNIKKFYLDNYFSDNISQEDKDMWFDTNEQAKKSVEIIQKLQEKSKHHKDKFTGIYDMDGTPINNGDEICIYENSTYNKENYGKVVWRNGNYVWKDVKGKRGFHYNIYAWRHSVKVLKTNLPSIYVTTDLETVKDKWFRSNVGILCSERKLLNQCFEDAFKLGQELKQEEYDK